MAQITGIAGAQILGHQGSEPSTITIDGDTIGSIVDGETSAHAPVIDGRGLIVGPGFIDLQINGGFGIDLRSDPGAMWDLGRLLPRHGVTGFLPTIITSPTATTDAALAAIGRRPDGYVGAEPLGLHFEGPMLSPQRPGAHPVEFLVAPHLEVIARWSSETGVALVTIAPELPGAAEVIAELVSRGVVVAAGHSAATSDEARAGIDVGITGVTHLFNAMAPLGHRTPNLAGLALADRDLVAGLIVDGVHVDPVAVLAAWNAKGADGIALVTDAVAAMGQPPGTYRFAGGDVTADEVSVRNANGTLAGSVLTMDRAVRHLATYTGCTPADAVISASTTPARLIGDPARGRIEPGRIADLVLLDQNLDVQITVCGGRVVYVSETAAARVPGHPREDI